MSAPVLLVGAQRSGTTALAWALSEAYASAGGLFTVNGKLPYLLDRWVSEEDVAARHLRADEILHALRRRPPGGLGVDRWLRRTEGALRSAAAAVADGSECDAASLSRSVVAESYAEAGQWGDKYNEYLLMAPRLLRMVPDAKVVLVVRHPLAVADSVLAWTGDRPWRPASRDAALHKWLQWHARWDAGAPLPGPRVLVVDYDDVCRGAVTGVLSDFVGLDLSDALGVMRTPPGTPTATSLPPDVARMWDRLREQAVECRKAGTPRYVENRGSAHV